MVDEQYIQENIDTLTVQIDALNDKILEYVSVGDDGVADKLQIKADALQTKKEEWEAML